ncbi:hypothetical protein W03_09500 [Nitrosomonas sp. PY1]|uniref:hypothetical protein n=1 Tax=Nitrosomonas sp. PY1 TaxID=1803906 RepID=UPI001FC7E415|nr:hypothetical protein [Nitrosomonas sp. PY1]GKS68946.1 hypothetical protein W03_09500 [Nitrosomonas sp. PY1]
MSKNKFLGRVKRAPLAWCVVTMIPIFFAQLVMAQAPGIRNPVDANQSQQPVMSTSPENLQESKTKSTRKIHRIGTAIPASPNAVSIKSTEAGMIRRSATLPSSSGCTNCGIVDFVSQSLQGNQMNAIVTGVVAGTVAREVIHSRNAESNLNSPYHVGITLNDGRQAVIALPDASNLQQGDRIKLIDGTLFIDRE